MKIEVYDFLDELQAVQKNCDGYGLQNEVEATVGKWSRFLFGEPLVAKVARFVELLDAALDECEGSELHEYLSTMKIPRRPKNRTI